MLHGSVGVQPLIADGNACMLVWYEPILLHTLPTQVTRLTKQYEEIAALAASAGLQLEPLDLPPPHGQPAAAAAAPQAAATPAAAPAPAAQEPKPAPAAAAGSSSGSSDGGAAAGSSGSGRASRFRKLAEPEARSVEYGEVGDGC